MPTKPFNLLAMQLFHPISGQLYSVLETEDLILIPTNTSHIDALHETCFGNDITMENYANREPQPYERTVARCKDHEDRQKDGDPFHGFTITKREGNQVIGLVNAAHGIDDKDGNRTPGNSELGIIIHHEEWNKGYGTQAVTAVVQHYLPLLRAHGFETDGALLTTASATVLKKDNPHSVTLLTGVYGGDQMSDIIAYNPDPRFRIDMDVIEGRTPVSGFVSSKKFETDSKAALTPAP